MTRFLTFYDSINIKWTVLSTFGLLFFVPISIFAATVLVAWDYDNNAGVLGFRVYVHQGNQRNDHDYT